ncbi:MAG: hypothetical protein HQL13_03010 [Candidatus Omnitrophica bacterium]|nr:hypothetical protein [Candidatus Omnitrophota bacterium]
MDPKTKKQLLIIACLVPVLILMVFNTSRTLKEKAKVKPVVQAQPQDKIGTALSSETKGPELPVKEPQTSKDLFKGMAEADKEGAVKRDPFSFWSSKSKKEASVQNGGLSAILWGQGEPLAVIDHQVVKKGDKVASNTVVEIKEESVVLSAGDKNIELNLHN